MTNVTNAEGNEGSLPEIPSYFPPYDLMNPNNGDLEGKWNENKGFFGEGFG